jgi:hypothetical protein
LHRPSNAVGIHATFPIAVACHIEERT